MMLTSSEPVLEAQDVEMFLGEGAARVHALQGVSLAVAAGELTLLMGPSGSGKSTLLSILGCILKQSKGNVRVAGVATANLNTEQLATLRREYIGFVFQSYNLFPGLTALENVKTGLAIRRRNGQNTVEAATRALEAVGLGHRMTSLPGHMSGGEQQRVAMARAIVANPSIILADEPTAALDSEAGRVVMQQLQRLAREQHCAVLVVSHDNRALAFADRVVGMQDGKILTDNASSLTAVATAGPMEAGIS
jgi:putative ABC transport system ATP-binding protein